MLELRIVKDGAALPAFDLPSAIGRAGAAREIGDQIEALICLLDDLGGDPDLEDGGDDEPAGDEQDASFPEWRPFDPSTPRMEAGMAGRLAREDDEEDDHSGGVGAEDDFDHPQYLMHALDRGPGCPVSDPAEYSADTDVDDRPIADPEAYRHHLLRIRSERCTRHTSRYVESGFFYRLMPRDSEPARSARILG